MPRNATKPAPVSAPITRALSALMRSIPIAPINSGEGMPAAISAFRMPISEGRTRPHSKATPQTSQGESSPAMAQAVSTAASTAYQARMADSTRRCPTLSPITPNMGESSVPISRRDPNTASHVTDPVSVSTYQPRISVSISKAQEVARSAGH